MALFSFKKDCEETSVYTAGVKIPQYLPNKECPPLESLIDFTKYTELIRKIKNSNVTAEEKAFLKYAAARHLVFRYSLIADYYTHADKEMQELMEQSALVILDINDAIADGYVKLSKDIKKILEKSGEIAGEK